jgi:hypothetical protein
MPTVRISSHIGTAGVNFSGDAGEALLKINSHYGCGAVGLTQHFFKRYLALTETQRGVVRDVVGEFKR